VARADTLDRIRAEIDARLRELLPRVQEYAAIEAAERLLGDSAPRASAGNGRARRGRRRKSSPASNRRSVPRPTSERKRSRSTRKPRGANQTAILKALREQATLDAPLTARQIADASGLAPATVHAAVRSLTKKRVVRVIEGPANRKAFILAG